VISPRLFAALLRLVFDLALLGIALFSLLLLALRFAVLPKIEDYRPEIVAHLSEAVGHPVSLGQLRAGWDGWNPTLEIAELTVRGKAGDALLTLPRVRTTVSWQSLLLLDLRLKALVIEQPSLRIARNAQGKFSVGGLEVDPETAAPDSNFADWLLRQRRVEIHDALLTWQDDFRQAPQLVLDRVNFRLENWFGQHRFGLVGVPPAEIAAPLDVRGDFHGESLAEWNRLDGKAYARLDYADVATWREWLPLPQQFARGEGALRLWFEFAQGAPKKLTADLELKDVSATLAEGLPELQLKRLSGRLAWRADAQGQQVEARRLVIEAKGASTPEPLDFALKLDRKGEEWQGGDAKINTVDLAAMSILAGHLPLPEEMRRQVRERSPRGLIRNARFAWRGAGEALEPTVMEGEFIGLGLASAEGQPGFANLSGKVQGDGQRGSLQLASRASAIELPKVFAAPIAMDSFDAKVNWRRSGREITVQIGEAEFSNAHAAGSASGEYRHTGQGPGKIDLKAKLSRADPRFVHAYLPLVVSASARSYLRRSLTGGVARDARLTLRGDLADFPFDDAQKGIFEIRVRAEDASMEYAPGWPELRKVRADLLFRGSRMEIVSNQGETLGVKIGNVTVTIPDLGASEPVLQVRGEAQGATADFLRFVETSPVLGMIDHFTEGMSASGPGHLDLRLAIPLAKPQETKVVGEFSITGNRLEINPDVPPLEKATGKIRFTEESVRAEGVNAEMLGGPAQALVSSAEGSVRISARGSANAEELARVYPSAFLRKVSGRSDWQAEVRVRGGKAQWSVDSSLRGVKLDLPAPLAKSAEEPLPLHLEHREVEGGRSLFEADLGKRVEFRMLRTADARTGQARFDRAFLGFNGAAADLSQPGLWIRGEIEDLALDRWLDYRPQADAPAGPADGAWPAAGDLAGLDLRLGAVTVMNRRFENLSLAASARSGRMNINVASKQVAGTLAWNSATPVLPNGQLVARLQRLSLPQDENEPRKDVAAPSGADDWPALDVVAENFSLKGKPLGKLELKASAEGKDWKLDRLKLVNNDGSIEAAGKWNMTGQSEATQVDLRLEVREAGAYLARFGMPDAIKGAPTKLAGALAWQGPPQDLDYASLSGTVKLEVGKGQFTKIDPGIGKLLGVLSLQALPRRLTLDFGDLFSSGFAFDSISGEVRIEQGVMRTEKLLLEGPSAKVEIRGSANIAAETQDLRVKVFPSLTTSAAITAGLAVNPVAGGVTWLLSNMLKNPLDRLFSYEYHVTGAWSDPQVANVAANSAGNPAEYAKVPEPK